MTTERFDTLSILIVDDIAQVRFLLRGVLRQLGVQHVQGYAVGRPAPIEDAFAAMEQTRLAEMAVILNL